MDSKRDELYVEDLRPTLAHCTSHSLVLLGSRCGIISESLVMTKGQIVLRAREEEEEMR